MSLCLETSIPALSSSPTIIAMTPALRFAVPHLEPFGDFGSPAIFLPIDVFVLGDLDSCLELPAPLEGARDDLSLSEPLSDTSPPSLGIFVPATCCLSTSDLSLLLLRPVSDALSFSTACPGISL